ncbi:hypothetical protein ACLBR5_32235 [Escherichia coli]
MDVSAGKGIYEDIIPEGKREFIQKHSKAVMASCDSEIKRWYGKQTHGGCHVVSVSVWVNKNTELLHYISMQ